MAKRGRKPKNATVATKVDHAKLLKQFEQEQLIQLETFYRSLAKIKKDVDGESDIQKIQTQNNIVFAGSTADLMKMISAERAKIIDSE